MTYVDIGIAKLRQKRLKEASDLKTLTLGIYLKFKSDKETKMD